MINNEEPLCETFCLNKSSYFSSSHSFTSTKPECLQLVSHRVTVLDTWATKMRERECLLSRNWELGRQTQRQTVRNTASRHWYCGTQKRSTWPSLGAGPEASRRRGPWTESWRLSESYPVEEGKLQKRGSKFTEDAQITGAELLGCEIALWLWRTTGHSSCRKKV